MNSTYQPIYDALAEVPYGMVISYGGLAKKAGLFRGARMVGWALSQLPAGSLLPWHRVINHKGMLSIVNPHVHAGHQKELLEAEGVRIIEKDGTFWVENPPWFS